MSPGGAFGYFLGRYAARAVSTDADVDADDDGVHERMRLSSETPRSHTEEKEREPGARNEERGERFLARRSA